MRPKVKKNFNKLSLLSLALITSCSLPLNFNQLPMKNSGISGQVEFPKLKKFQLKASLADIGANATVSLINPADHPTAPNVTVATTLTDTNGNFTINFNRWFSCQANPT